MSNMKLTLIKEFGTNEVFAAFTNDEKPLYVGSTPLGKDWANWANEAALKANSVKNVIPVNMFLEGPTSVTPELVNLLNFKPLVKSNEVIEHYQWIDSRLDGLATKSIFGNARRRLRGPSSGARRALGARSVGKRRRGRRGNLGEALRANRVPEGMRPHPLDGDGDGEIYDPDPRRRRYVGFMPARETNSRWARPRPRDGDPDTSGPRGPRRGLPPANQMRAPGGGRRRTGRLQRLRDRLGEMLDVSDSEFDERPSSPRRVPGAGARSRNVARRISLPETEQDDLESLRDEIANILNPDLDSNLDDDAEGWGFDLALDLDDETRADVMERVVKLMADRGILLDENGRKQVAVGFKRADNNPANISPQTILGYNLPVRVEKGDNGIDSVDAAIAAVKDGRALSEIPDDFLAIAILENTSFGRNRARFKGKIKGGSVNDPLFVTDETTGIEYMMKYLVNQSGGRRNPRFLTRDGNVEINSYFEDEDLNEFVGQHLAERLGFAQGQVRYISEALPVGGNPDTPGRAIMVELGQSETGSDLYQAAERQDESEDIPDDQRVALQLLDYLLLNTDRHYGNWLQNRTGEDEESVYPIDHGGALGGSKAWLPEIAEGPEGLRLYVRDSSNRFPNYSQWRTILQEEFGEEFDDTSRSQLAERYEPIVKLLQDRLRKLEEEMSLENAWGYLQITSGRDYIIEELNMVSSRLAVILDRSAREVAADIANGLMTNR